MWSATFALISVLVLPPIGVRIENHSHCPVHVALVDGSRRLRQVYVESLRREDVAVHAHSGSILRFVVTPGAGCGFARFEVNGYFEPRDAQLLVTVGNGALLSKVARR